MSADYSVHLDNVSVDSSNKIGLYGDDLANLNGLFSNINAATAEIANNALISSASVISGNQQALNAIAEASAAERAVSKNATATISTYLIVAGAFLLGLFLVLKKK